MMKPIRPNLDKSTRWWGIPNGTPLYVTVALGNASQFQIAAFLTDRGVFFGVEGFGCYTFGGWVHWSYFNEKIRITESDARILADIVNHLGEWEGEEQGWYRTMEGVWVG